MKRYILLIVLCICFTSCKQYELVIEGIKPLPQHNKCVYMFYPINRNSINYLNTDTTSFKVSYSFIDTCNKYEEGDILLFHGKISMVKQLTIRK